MVTVAAASAVVDRSLGHAQRQDPATPHRAGRRHDNFSSVVHASCNWKRDVSAIDIMIRPGRATN